MSTQPKTESAHFASRMRNVQGTLAAEGLSISPSARDNIDRIASGKTSYQQVLRELKAKYEKRD